MLLAAVPARARNRLIVTSRNEKSRCAPRFRLIARESLTVSAGDDSRRAHIKKYLKAALALGDTFAPPLTVSHSAAKQLGQFGTRE
jgi:uncharacterized protein (DUF736 family)